MSRRVSGRVPSDRGEKRLIKIDFRVSDDEHTKFKARARQLGVTLSQLMRMLGREEVGLPAFGEAALHERFSRRPTDVRQTSDVSLTNDASRAPSGTGEEKR